MSLGSDIRAYAAAVENLPRYEDEGMAENVPLWRDRIEARLSAGAVPTPEEQTILAQADAALIEQRRLLLTRWPGVFTGNNLPRARWWWHLDSLGAPGREWEA